MVQSAANPLFVNICFQEKLELWEIRQYNERLDRERALEREKRLQEEAKKRAEELRVAALQRKQQQEQAKQQINLLKQNRKKVQNAIKTQQRKTTTIFNKPVIQPALKPITAGASMSSVRTVGAATSNIRPTTVVTTRQPVVPKLPMVSGSTNRYQAPLKVGSQLSSTALSLKTTPKYSTIKQIGAQSEPKIQSRPQVFHKPPSVIRNTTPMGKFYIIIVLKNLNL